MRRVVVALGAVLLLLAVGCGVPEDDKPQELTADEVPFGLLTTPTTTTEPTASGSVADLYFVNADGQVTASSREVEDQSPRAIITALLETDPLSLDPGLTSNIPPETTLLDIFSDDRDNEVLTVDLSAEFTTIEGPRFIAAVAQIVFTATELAGTTSVAFRQEGEPLPVQDEEGAVQNDPVSRSDYLTLLDS